MLIYTISFERRPSMKVNIHNQCSDFKLTSRKWFNTCAYWNESPGEEVDARSMMSVGLISSLTEFEGSLMYQLQRKRVESDDQLESTYTLLFITWKSEGYKELRARVHLIVCDKQIKWNGYRLREYYQRCVSQLCTYTGPIEDTWLLHGGTVLMIGLELYFTQRDGVLSVTISDGVKDNHTKIPELIDSKM
jgi:hypothetical protein